MGGAKRFSIKNIDLIANIFIGVLAFFFLANLKGGQDWGGDFSMYIMNARNIVNGAPYAQTQYLYNLDTASYGPVAYPPVFPLLLTPVIAVWGVNLLALKAVGIFCFVGLLFYLYYKVIPGRLQPALGILYLVIAGLYPPFFVQLDRITSDIPFLLICAISLRQINDVTDSGKGDIGHWYQAVWTGVVIYLAYGTRAVGIVLLPVVFCLDLLRNKKIHLTTFIVLATASSLILLQYGLIPQTGSYFNQLPQNFYQVLLLLSRTLVSYFELIFSMFQSSHFFVQAVIFLVVLEFVVIGLLGRLKRGVSSYELFCLFYLAGLLFWPSYQEIRFLFPIVPFYILFCLEGFQTILNKLEAFPVWLLKALSLFLLLGFGFYYDSIYTGLVPRPASELEANSAQEVMQYVIRETGPDDVVAFFKPRVLALFTGCESVALAIPAPDGDSLGRMSALGVTYVIVRLDDVGDDQPEMLQLIHSNPLDFQLVYQNAEFGVYRFMGG